MGIKKSPALDTFLSNLGQEIKKKRRAKGLSMEQLGVEMGADRTQILRIEKGYNITCETILKLSLALGTSPSNLFNFDLSAKDNDLDILISNNRANKLKSTKKASKISFSDKKIKELLENNKNAELQKAVLELWDTVKKMKG